MDRLFYEKYKERPHTIPPFQIDDNGVTIMYPIELFCRVHMDGMICPRGLKFKTHRNLRAHIRQQHPKVLIKSWGRKKLTQEELRLMEFEYKRCGDEIQAHRSRQPSTELVQTADKQTQTDLMELRLAWVCAQPVTDDHRAQNWGMQRD